MYAIRSYYDRSRYRFRSGAGTDECARRCRSERRPDPAGRGVDMVRREVVGAHYGLRDWLAQRITAVVMAVRNNVV